MGQGLCKGRLCDDHEASGLKRRQAQSGKNGLCLRCHNESQRDAELKPPLRAKTTGDEGQLARPSTGFKVVLAARGDSSLMLGVPQRKPQRRKLHLICTLAVFRVQCSGDKRGALGDHIQTIGIGMNASGFAPWGAFFLHLVCC